jgi:hypothetical protein
VTLHDVTAQTVGGRERPLQIHPRARGEIAEIASSQSLWREIRRERITTQFDRSEAHAIYRDARSLLQIRRHLRALNAQTRASGLLQ